MRTTPIIAFGLFLLIMQSGCKLVSETMFAAGSFFDPDNVRCVDHIGNCSLCGESSETGGQLGTGDLVIQAGHQCPQCGGAAGQPPLPYDLVDQMEQIQTTTDGFRKELDIVNNELVERGQALVHTRAELSRVQTDVVSLRDNVTNWQASMKQLHQQIRERDSERLAKLNELSSGLRSVLQEATMSR